MTIQPNVTQYGAPVKQSIWRYFCYENEAKGMLEEARKTCPNAQLVDGNNIFFGGQLVYQDNITKAWVIQGTVKEGQNTLTILESAGDLLDRSLVPNPFVDRNPDGTLGGPNLKMTDIGNGYTQLSWGK